MNMEGTNKKKGKAKTSDHGFGPMGKGMFEMMSACCAGRGGFSDCSTMMEEFKKQCCAPNKGTAESERKKK